MRSCSKGDVRAFKNEEAENFLIDRGDQQIYACMAKYVGCGENVDVFNFALEVEFGWTGRKVDVFWVKDNPCSIRIPRVGIGRL